MESKALALGKQVCANGGHTHTLDKSVRTLKNIKKYKLLIF